MTVTQMPHIRRIHTNSQDPDLDTSWVWFSARVPVGVEGSAFCPGLQTRVSGVIPPPHPPTLHISSSPRPCSQPFLIFPHISLFLFISTASPLTQAPILFPLSSAMASSSSTHCICSPPCSPRDLKTQVHEVNFSHLPWGTGAHLTCPQPLRDLQLPSASRSHPPSHPVALPLSTFDKLLHILVFASHVAT